MNSILEPATLTKNELFPRFLRIMFNAFEDFFHKTPPSTSAVIANRL